MILIRFTENGRKTKMWLDTTVEYEDEFGYYCVVHPVIFKTKTEAVKVARDRSSIDFDDVVYEVVKVSLRGETVWKRGE